MRAKVPRHETIWRVEVQLHIFLISAMDGGELSASRRGHCIPWDKSSVPIECEGGWSLVMLLKSIRDSSDVHALA